LFIILIDEYDEKLFHDFCKDPHTEIREMKRFDKDSQKKEELTNKWNCPAKSLDPFISSPSHIMNVIISNLENLYKKGVDFKAKYADIFTKEFLIKQEATFNYLSNKKQDLKDKIVSDVVSYLQEH
jgi:hypothetical protein